MMNRVARTACTWWLVAGATLPLPALAQDAHIGVAQQEAVQDVAAVLLAAIYKQAGLTVKISPFPITRLADMVSKNEIDGEVARIGLYFERNPQLIKVEPSYYRLVTTAFAKADKRIVIGSADDLKKYRVGIIKGVFHAAKATEGVPDVVTVTEVSQLFKMLEADRIDVAVDVSMNGVDVINQLNLAGNVKPVGDLAQREFFHALIPDKKSLAPKLSAAIKAMTASGELARLTKATEQNRLSKQPGPDAVRRY